MITALLAVALTPQSGIVVVDSLAVGIVQSGKWRSMDSPAIESFPKQTVSTSLVAKLTAEPCYQLERDGTVQALSRHSLKFTGEDGDPGGRGWILQPEADDGPDLVWFGPKPAAPKMTFAAPTNSTYLGVVKDFLKKKGFARAKPYLHKVVLVDLDGNGNNEALIFAASRPDGAMFETYQGNLSIKRPNDYSMILVRYVSGKSTKLCELYYTDGRKSGLAGHNTFAGLWNLDGLPGLEILVRWSGYESWSGSVFSFKGGKSKELAVAGDGV